MYTVGKDDRGYWGHRVLCLDIIASSACILATATALFLYRTVFADHSPSPNYLLGVAFFGSYGLCVLLTACLWNRQAIVWRLQCQVVDQRTLAKDGQSRASAEFLRVMPNVISFFGNLVVEHRQSCSASQNLSIMVITVRLSASSPDMAKQSSPLGDAARAISGQLHIKESVYILSPGCFGIILPNTDVAAAEKTRQRMSKSLTGAAALTHRFSHEIGVINYPADACSAYELELAICNLMPGSGRRSGAAV
jgi:hypothetical protein